MFYESYIAAAEKGLEDAMDAGIYSDGTANGNKQITGLATAIPITNTSGVYGGIDRANALIWRTQTYDANSFLAGSTQVSSTTVRPMLNYVMTKQSRGRDYADLLIMSPEHYAAYDAATIAIQRQQNETSLGKLALARSNTSAGENAPRSCSTAASGPTCRPIQPSVLTPIRSGCAITPSATSTSCSTVTVRCQSTRMPSPSLLAGWVS
jgi:hypothetical protein